MSYSWRNILLALIVGLSLFMAGCAKTSGQPTELPPEVVSTPQQKSLDLTKEYQGYDGAFVLYDLQANTISRYNPSRCAQGFLPASTFKILNSLIALETGVIPDKDYLIKWDGTVYDVPAWNQDQTMETAFKNSVVWYYQQVARRIGSETMQKYVSLAGYGNEEIGGALDSFWLDGEIRISADQQVDFLRRFYSGELPFSARTISIVKDLLLAKQSDGVSLSGKTGSTGQGSQRIAWYVGYVEANDDVYFFASTISPLNADSTPIGETARAVTLQVLQNLQLLPAGNWAE